VTAIVATLGLFAVGAFGVHLVRTTEWFSSTEFTPAAFRRAALSHDNGAMQSQAQAAVDSGALIGLSAARLQRTLGPPSRAERHGRRYVWDLGATSGLIIDGWGASVLNVDFDAKTRRVEYAEVFATDD
jgi:hypothetical protein